MYQDVQVHYLSGCANLDITVHVLLHLEAPLIVVSIISDCHNSSNRKLS